MLIFFLKIEIFKIIFLQEKLLFFAPIFFWWKVYTKTWFVPTFEVVLEF